MMSAMPHLPLPGGRALATPAQAGRILASPRAASKSRPAIRWLVQVLAWVGLLAGILVLALQGTLSAWPPADLLSPVTRQATPLPRVMALGAGVILAIHPFGEDHPAVAADRGSPPWDNLGLDANDVDLEDDDPSAMVGQPQGIRVFPLSPTAMGMGDARHAFSSRSRFLARPQLLTRA